MGRVTGRDGPLVTVWVAEVVVLYNVITRLTQALECDRLVFENLVTRQ
jgi:hypothetical protein